MGRLGKHVTAAFVTTHTIGSLSEHVAAACSMEGHHDHATVLMVYRGGSPNTDRVPGAATAPVAKWSSLSRAFAVQVLSTHLSKQPARLCRSARVSYKRVHPMPAEASTRLIAAWHSSTMPSALPRSARDSAILWSVAGKILHDRWKLQVESTKTEIPRAHCPQVGLLPPTHGGCSLLKHASHVFVDPAQIWTFC